MWEQASHQLNMPNERPEGGEDSQRWNSVGKKALGKTGSLSEVNWEEPDCCLRSCGSLLVQLQLFLHFVSL